MGQALAWNGRTGRPDAKGAGQAGQPREALSTDAGHKGRGDALQASCCLPSPHSSGPLPGHELAGLRSGPAPARRPHAVAGPSWAGELGGTEAQHARRSVPLLRPGNRAGADLAARIPLGPASGRGVRPQRAGTARAEAAGAGPHDPFTPRAGPSPDGNRVSGRAAARCTWCWTAPVSSCSAKVSGVRPSTAVAVANRNHRRLGSQSSAGRAHAHCNGFEGSNPHSLHVGA